MFPKLSTAILIVALIILLLIPKGSFSFHTWRVVGFIAIPIAFLLRALLGGRD